VSVGDHDREADPREASREKWFHGKFIQESVEKRILDSMEGGFLSITGGKGGAKKLQRKRGAGGKDRESRGFSTPASSRNAVYKRSQGTRKSRHWPVLKKRRRGSKKKIRSNSRALRRGRKGVSKGR